MSNLLTEAVDRGAQHALANDIHQGEAEIEHFDLLVDIGASEGREVLANAALICQPTRPATTRSSAAAARSGLW